METVTIQISVPKNMVPFIINDEHDQNFERNAMILYGMIQMQKISHGRAAEILGVKKWDLIEFYNSKGLPYLNQTKEDLLSDLEVFDTIREKLNDCNI
ncbi:MAG: UPF0175 family protein [Synergistaceae bacterium]|nr:UPF0175 family protein [Synergistaceae bacterium]MBQ6435826.1 UPF0175 family protein [Synergistaceae bacterium]MBQ6738406.1 UPF0175 family protein [Synergistaceae bacterium]MBQ7068478.1 UPF0175 family protein [Synergistaceae bacterium]MBR0075066.1 UPF0175 family protein [Synergistaceae bacterium]